MKLRRQNRNRIVFACILFIFIVGFSSFLYAATNTPISNFSETDAFLCINQSREIMVRMINEGFNVLRINDSLRQAESNFEAQKILKSKKRNYDFSLVKEYCLEISKIETEAYLARDEFNSLLKFYNDFIDKKMNASSVDAIILEISNEIKDERYENVKSLVEKTYSEIIKVQS